jgi:EAL domain-containing protein (putative c-di-GMP-specific phosphodiesterase class I)
MVHEAAAQAAQHSIATVGVQAAVAVTAEGVTEGGRAATLRQLLARIAQGYYQERAMCLTAIVSQHVTGPMLHEIDHLARVGQCEPLQHAKLLLSELQTALRPTAE